MQEQRPVRQRLEASYQHGHGDEVSLLRASGKFMCSSDSPLWSDPALSAEDRASTGVPPLQRTIPVKFRDPHSAVPLWAILLLWSIVAARL